MTLKHAISPCGMSKDSQCCDGIAHEARKLYHVACCKFRGKKSMLACAKELGHPAIISLQDCKRSLLCSCWHKMLSIDSGSAIVVSWTTITSSSVAGSIASSGCGWNAAFLTRKSRIVLEAVLVVGVLLFLTACFLSWPSRDAALGAPVVWHESSANYDHHQWSQSYCTNRCCFGQGLRDYLSADGRVVGHPRWQHRHEPVRCIDQEVFR